MLGIYTNYKQNWQLCGWLYGDHYGQSKLKTLWYVLQSKYPGDSGGNNAMKSQMMMS